MGTGGGQRRMGRPAAPAQLQPPGRRRALAAALLRHPLLPAHRRQRRRGGDALEGAAGQHRGDPVGARRRRGHPSGAHRLLPGHEQAGEALRVEGVQPQLRLPGAHRGERLQHLRLAALAAPGPPHVPLAQRPGPAPAWAPDAAPAPRHSLPAPARRLSPAPGFVFMGGGVKEKRVILCIYTYLFFCYLLFYVLTARRRPKGRRREANAPAPTHGAAGTRRSPPSGRRLGSALPLPPSHLRPAPRLSRC